MADNIQTITDKKLFQNIFYKYFIGCDVFLRTKSGNLKIEFLGYTDGLTAFKIPYLKNISENCLVFTKYKEHILYAQLKFAEKQEEKTYIFFPVKIQIISGAQKESRKDLSSGEDSKKILYVTNIITDFIIVNTLAMSAKNVDRVKDTIKDELAISFEHIKIFFINEGSSDVRMKHFATEKRPIMISNFNEKPTDEKKLTEYSNFINNIYSKDYYLLNRKGFISEISVPILYKAKIPYGYVQVNNQKPLPESILSIIKRIAVVVEELLKKYKVFKETNERLLVSDASKNGLSIVFNERRYIRYFKEKSLVYFDLILPDGKKSSILATVMNIAFLENKLIKIGCHITDIDALSEVYYDEFLESIGLPTS